MVWVNSGSENSYWMPEVIPEYTEEWQTEQMSKSYVKMDGSVTGHPGWYFGNQAYVSDEYLYHNEGWYTIIDNRPEEIDENNNQYVIVETPISEWEIFDTYKKRKKYKKYLHIEVSPPKFEFGKTINHSLDYDDNNMTATDTYNEIYLPAGELELSKETFLEKVRLVRNFILDKTDYYVVLSKEKNLQLSQYFLNYRQNLRDIPQQFDFENLSENDFNLINKNYNILSTGNTYNGDIDTDNILFFPNLPSNILE